MLHFSLIASLLMGCSHSEPDLVGPKDVTLREPSDPSMHAPALKDPVKCVTNPRRQKLYSFAKTHFAEDYAAEQSMCAATPFLWAVNPQLQDIYDVGKDETIFVPSREDYARWRTMNANSLGQSVTYISDPK